MHSFSKNIMNPIVGPRTTIRAAAEQLSTLRHWLPPLTPYRHGLQRFGRLTFSRRHGIQIPTERNLLATSAVSTATLSAIHTTRHLNTSNVVSEDEIPSRSAKKNAARSTAVRASLLQPPQRALTLATSCPIATALAWHAATCGAGSSVRHSI